MGLGTWLWRRLRHATPSAWPTSPPLSPQLPPSPSPPPYSSVQPSPQPSAGTSEGSDGDAPHTAALTFSAAAAEVGCQRQRVETLRAELQCEGLRAQQLQQLSVELRRAYARVVALEHELERERERAAQLAQIKYDVRQQRLSANVQQWQVEEAERKQKMAEQRLREGNPARRRRPNKAQTLRVY